MLNAKAEPSAEPKTPSSLSNAVVGVVSLDEDGRPMYRFAIEYDYDGKAERFVIWAYDFPDARARLAAIKSNGRILG